MMSMMKDAVSRWQRLKVPRTLTVIVRVGLAALTATLGAHEAEAKFFPLNTVPVPEPPNLAQFVKNKAAAIQLGKALFWDVQVGSDGKTSCATCHFHAGADSRAKNQLAPSAGAFAFPTGTNAFSTALGFGPDHELVVGDFPFTKHLNPNAPNLGAPADPPPADPNMISDTNDVTSSQGVFKRNFVGVTPLGNPVDTCTGAADGVFHGAAGNLRRASPRNAPSVFNAVFNLRQFWDGRGRENFNGINVKGVNNADGTGDPLAGAFKAATPLAVPKRVPLTDAAGVPLLQFSSLASQAVAPPTSPVILSCNGRLWAQIGQKLLNIRVKPLKLQQVDPTDSVLGLLANRRTGQGLLLSYSTMIKRSFQPTWWNSVKKVTVGGQLFTQMQANMPLFFGLAVQLYEATLVSDQTPFDQFLAGNAAALTPAQVAGMNLFMDAAPRFDAAGNPLPPLSCGECHAGAETTNASVSQAIRHARVDRGFSNIGARPTADDLGLGGIVAGVAVGVGQMKIPQLRNVELTGPYMHNGGKATLKEVVQHYNRGADFRNAALLLDLNKITGAPLITPLGMTPLEETNLVEFLKALTDNRVRIQAAPFDHPSLDVPDGSLGVDLDGDGQADDNMIHIPAVGGAGDPAHPLQPFMGLDPQTPE